MEENSDVHMETDVSSTTDDVVDTQEVTGSNGQVEMTITVEKVDEEATSNIQNKTQADTGNNVSSLSTVEDKAAPEESPTQSTVKSPNKNVEGSKLLQKSSVKTDSPQKMTSIISPIKNAASTSSPQVKTGSADSSTKMPSSVSTYKAKTLSKEKSFDKDPVNQNLAVQNIKKLFQKSSSKDSTQKSPAKDEVTITKIIQKETNILKSPDFNAEGYKNIIQKSPIKDSSIQKSPTKIREVQTVLKSPTKEPDQSPAKIAEEQKSRALQVSYKSSPPVKLNRRSKVLHGTTITSISSQNTTPSNKDEDSKSDDNDASPDKTVESEQITPQLAGTDVPLDISSAMETEASNDSQLSSTASDKEHKGISRELKSLIKSAKESKIINECNQLTSKTRKSRTNLDNSLNAEAESVKERRASTSSQGHDSDKPGLKRSMRSQNPDFVSKCQKFLNSVTSKVMKDSDETMSEDDQEESKQKKSVLREEEVDSTETPKKKKVAETLEVQAKNKNKLRSDPYCWKCHWAIEENLDDKPQIYPSMNCSVCVRTYHIKCLSIENRKTSPEKNWVCPECLQILHAEGSETRSLAMKKISLGMLCDLLKYALERMMALPGVEPFLQPVDRSAHPDYDDVIVHPMDLSQIQRNITDGHYGSREAFIADAQWILHNSILFNACEQTFTHSKLTSAARALVRTCRAEMAEIETCPECYAGAHSRNLTYFTDVCSTPHMLLWAKLKGFPYWPAKAMSINQTKEGWMVDVRFFGQHDKAWLPIHDCYLYSEKDPNTNKNKHAEILTCRQEVEVHIRSICRKYGSFVYAPFKTVFDHSKMTEQLKLMIPSFDGEIKSSNASPVTKDKSRYSKSSKCSSNDGDNMSECDESSVTSRKAEEDDNATETIKDTQKVDTTVDEKDKTMEADTSRTIEAVPTRKRRRSVFPEVSTPSSESTAQKKKKAEDKPEDKPESAKKKPDMPVQAKKHESTPKKPAADPKIIKTYSKKPDTESKKPEPVTKKPEQETKKHEEPTCSQNDKDTKIAAEVSDIKKTEEKPKEKESLNTTFEEKESLRVTPIKLVALPRANKLTPKIFTTAKIVKATTDPPNSSTPNNSQSTPNTSSTPTDDEEPDKPKRKKITKADKFIMTEGKDKTKVLRRNSTNSRNSSTSSSRNSRHSRANKSLTTSTPKSDKKSDSGNDASNKEVKPTNNKKNEADRSILKTKAAETPKSKEEKGPDTADKKKKKVIDDVTLAATAQTVNSTGLPTISSVCSLSTTSQKTNSTNVKVTSAPKTIEITVEANSNSSIFTPTSTNNVGNMKEAVSKLQKLRNDTEPFVGRVGVKAFARMTSPDINDDVQVEIKAEPIDIDEVDEERQMEKMDLMNACKLQPVNQTQALRDVRINKVVVTPSIVVKKGAKIPEVRPRAKKTFPQPRRVEEGRSELNGKNSMVYIPIQPPMTQAPMRQVRPGAHLPGVVMPASVTAGPRMNAPLTSVNNTVNTVTTPLRPTTSTLTSPPPLQASNPTVGQVGLSSNVPTVGPTTVHTVPLMTSVNGQWMFSLQPMMSVGGVDAASSPTMVNGMTERPTTSLVPVSSTAPSAVVLPSPVLNRTKNNTSTSTGSDNGTPAEMPRLQQRPLMSPFDANTPIGNVPPPSTAGPITAKLNQNAVKLTDFFRTLLEDSIERLDEPLTHVTALKVQLEQARWRHQQNIDELKHNHELTLSEMRQSFEKEKVRAVSEARRAAQIELEAAIKLTKSKQWCVNCHQEAQFYCCWNTSYCDYACQKEHWATHHSVCTQSRTLQLRQPEGRLSPPAPAERPPEVTITAQLTNRRDQATQIEEHKSITQQSALQILHNLKMRESQLVVSTTPKRDQLIILKNQKLKEPDQRHRDLEQRTLDKDANNADSETPESRLQSDIPPKNVPPTPSLTVGGKIAPTRVFTDASGAQKTSIIVSMVEDPSGNQTMKCLGTYKPPAPATAQGTNDDSGAPKKVVTSGGYLIVGSGTPTSVITPAAGARRPHIYYTHT